MHTSPSEINCQEYLILVIAISFELCRPYPTITYYDISQLILRWQIYTSLLKISLIEIIDFSNIVVRAPSLYIITIYLFKMDGYLLKFINVMEIDAVFVFWYGGFANFVLVDLY